MASAGAVAPVASDLVDFLNASPTAFHAVGKRPASLPHFPLVLSRRELDWTTNSVLLLLPAREDEAKRRLKAAWYTQLSEREEWIGLEPGRKYFFTRNYSTIVAFPIGVK
jgi:aspartyl aminopeptidase